MGIVFGGANMLFYGMYKAAIATVFVPNFGCIAPQNQSVKMDGQGQGCGYGSGSASRKWADIRIRSEHPNSNPLYIVL